MEFHVIRDELLSELALMMGVIEKKNTMPILANVYIKAENNELLLQATDLEVGIISRCSAQVVEGGEFTVNAKQLSDMLNSFSESQVSFSLSEGTMLSLGCGFAEFSIETMSTQDYPSIPECDFSGAMVLPVGFFSDCIHRVFFSVSNDPHKYALNGALMKIEEGEFYLVSTDGHRMSVVHRSMGPTFPDTSVIIPRKTLAEVRKSLGVEDQETEFKMIVVENRIFFEVGPRVLFSRLVDGKFPDYTKAIPENNDKQFLFDRKLLLDIVRRKSVLSSDKSKLVRMSFRSGELTVVLKNAERGESVDKIGIEYDGEPVNVGFNVDYVMEFLKQMRSAKVEINLRDESSQGLFKLVDGDEDEVDTSYQHVIMPMRLTG